MHELDVVRPTCATPVLSAGIRSGRMREDGPVESLIVYLGPCEHEFTGPPAEKLRIDLLACCGEETPE